MAALDSPRMSWILYLFVQDKDKQQPQVWVKDKCLDQDKDEVNNN
jgi:hypothetical protein